MRLFGNIRGLLGAVVIASLCLFTGGEADAALLRKGTNVNVSPQGVQVRTPSGFLGLRQHTTNVRFNNGFVGNGAQGLTLPPSLQVSHGRRFTSVQLNATPAYTTSQMLVNPQFRGQLNQLNSYTCPNNTAQNIRFVPNGTAYLTQPPITSA
jgi:hypothetical protein